MLDRLDSKVTALTASERNSPRKRFGALFAAVDADSRAQRQTSSDREDRLHRIGMTVLIQGETNPALATNIEFKELTDSLMGVPGVREELDKYHTFVGHIRQIIAARAAHPGRANVMSSGDTAATAAAIAIVGDDMADSTVSSEDAVAAAASDFATAISTANPDADTDSGTVFVSGFLEGAREIIEADALDAYAVDNWSPSWSLAGPTSCSGVVINHNGSANVIVPSWMKFLSKSSLLGLAGGAIFTYARHGKVTGNDMIDNVGAMMTGGLVGELISLPGHLGSLIGSLGRGCGIWCADLGG